MSETKKIPDVSATIETIEDAAKVLESTAQRLRYLVSEMRADGDLTRAGDALSAVQSMLPNLRLDLFVVRPLRALAQFNLKREG